MDFKNCVLKDEWENGHHRRVWIDRNGRVIADAYESYKVSREEYLLRNECRAILVEQVAPFLNRIIVNARHGIKVRFSKNSLGKVASDKAVTKSVVNGFSVQEHFEALADLRTIFENAELVGSFPDRNNDPNVVAMHRLQNKITLSSGKNAIAYMTLKEVKKEGNRFYTLELILEKYLRKGMEWWRR
ncbi:MAG: hypothetical protein IJ158_08600 [Treponema sp.]|nr:hypothetical protein [Treponema sp.]